MEGPSILRSDGSAHFAIDGQAMALMAMLSLLGWQCGHKTLASWPEWLPL